MFASFRSAIKACHAEFDEKELTLIVGDRFTFLLKPETKSLADLLLLVIFVIFYNLLNLLICRLSIIRLILNKD